jgi:hypothetical protein
VERGSEVLYGEGDGEEVEGVPGPAKEADLGRRMLIFGGYLRIREAEKK